MRNRLAIVAVVPSLTFLLFGPTACRQHYYVPPSMCESSAPYRLGEEQAMAGQPIDYARGAECSRDDLARFTASLEEGYRAGQQRYCDPQRARAAGSGDGVMHRPPSFQPQSHAICPNAPALQAAYSQGHQEGLERLCQPGPFEEVGNEHGAEGRPSLLDISKFTMCPADRLPELEAAFTRGYQSGLASFCEPASWEPWAHGRGADGHRAPDVRGEIGLCSAAAQSEIAFHVRRGYEAGLRTHCDNSGIVDAAREAARDGSAPVLPDHYIVCLDVFPETQTVFASGYRTELTWMQQRWGSRPPMLPARFRELTQHVRSQDSDSERLLLMKEAGQHNRFTSEQVRLLMQQLSYENDRVEIAATLYPVVVDRGNWDQVYELLYLHGQAALRERIAASP